MPPWKQRWGNVTHQVLGTKPVRWTEHLIERAYCVSYTGGVHYYEVTDQTLDVLSKARERAYAAFEQVVDPEFYQCPYCSSRDLQEVYGRRVYKCARCNDRVVTNEEFIYARIRRLRLARSALLSFIAWRAK
jgi:DNA-directed RNA polymerase subunit RPC12/RpoP